MIKNSKRIFLWRTSDKFVNPKPSFLTNYWRTNYRASAGDEQKPDWGTRSAGRHLTLAGDPRSVCVCVCMWMREREWERQRERLHVSSHITSQFATTLIKRATMQTNLDMEQTKRLLATADFIWGHYKNLMVITLIHHHIVNVFLFSFNNCVHVLHVNNTYCMHMWLFVCRHV